MPTPSPCKLPTCPILQLVCCHALLIHLQIAFQYHSPVKCFSKSWILLFYGLNTGPSAPAGAGLWRDVWLQSKWVREEALADTGQSCGAACLRDTVPSILLSLQRGSRKSLRDVAQRREVPTTQVFVVFSVPLCLNLTTKPLVSLLGKGPEQGPK